VADDGRQGTRVVAYGRWPSGLDEHTAGAGRQSRSSLQSDGTHLYWLESRPQERGRSVVVRADPSGRVVDASPPSVSVRSRVHEYGGGAYCVLGGPEGALALAYVDQTDQRVWLMPLEGNGAPRALSPEPPAGQRWHHGDLRATTDGRTVLAVRESHDGAGGVTHSLVSLSTGPTVDSSALWEGDGFVAAPRMDRAGARLAWLTWQHPDMPWDATELWVGELGTTASGAMGVSDPHRVAGGPSSGVAGDGESVGQPLWLDDGRLVFVSDAAGWWQPWSWEEGAAAPTLLCGDEGEFHGPDWALGQSTIAELGNGDLACRRRVGGVDQLGVVSGGGGAFAPLDQPCVTISAVCAHADGLAWLGSTPERPSQPWWGATASGDGWRTTPSPVLPPGRILLEAADVSVAESFSVPTARGEVPGLYYRPQLSGVEGPPGVSPPLVVFCHSGPTGCAEPGFDPAVQFFTSRGFAVAAVDYAGSIGYGRAYRRRLFGTWGLADADDCAAAALALAERGLADPGRMAARGSSAGGFTALCALARSRVFAGAVSWYGVTDLLALAATTHDFEAHYTDRLVGPLPEAAAEYRRRSPVNLVDQMEGAVLLLQGLDDPVVPPEQATSMAEALAARGLRVDYLPFEGESHGFRRAESVAAGLAAELAFYQDILCS
jgi:acetyl esterase/lipase